jgi:hypothetical protein
MAGRPKLAAPTRPARLLLNTREAAEAIGLSPAFLEKDRLTDRVIPFVRVGDRILYHLESVQAALLARQVGGGGRR